MDTTSLTVTHACSLNQPQAQRSRATALGLAMPWAQSTFLRGVLRCCTSQCPRRGLRRPSNRVASPSRLLQLCVTAVAAKAESSTLWRKTQLLLMNGGLCCVSWRGKLIFSSPLSLLRSSSFSLPIVYVYFISLSRYCANLILAVAYTMSACACTCSCCAGAVTDVGRRS